MAVAIISGGSGNHRTIAPCSHAGLARLHHRLAACERVRFFLDGGLLLETSHAPAGPLGLVVWLDNQFLQIAPWGHFRWGVVAKEEAQWLEIDWLAVERVTGSA